MRSTFRQTNRRQIIIGLAATFTLALAGTSPFTATAQAQANGNVLAASETMRGGDNNYVPNAPVVENLGTGFVVSGLVRRSDTGRPASGVRIQIWAATERGSEAHASNRGSVITDANGRYRLEMSPVAPQFGQPHLHMAYDDGQFETLFLRPVLNGRSETSVEINMVLQPIDTGSAS